jgi:hypothetical protein
MTARLGCSVELAVSRAVIVVIASLRSLRARACYGFGLVPRRWSRMARARSGDGVGADVQGAERLGQRS